MRPLRHALGAAVVCVAAVSIFGTPPAHAETAPAVENQSVLPHEEALRSFGEKLSESVEATQSDPGIPEILETLQSNIATIRRLREKIEGADSLTDELAADIADEVSSVAESFRRIADLAPEVFRRRGEELRTVDGVSRMTGFQVADANKDIQTLRADNERINERLTTETLTATEIEKMRMTVQANDAVISSLEMALAAWSVFSSRHGEIVQNLDTQTEALDVFFHALAENARVYESAARTIRLASSLREALSSLGSMSNIEALQADLVQSWGDLMRIVDEVKRGLDIPPGS